MSCITQQNVRQPNLLVLYLFWALSPRLGVLGGKRSHHTGRICRGILRGSGANFNFSQKKKKPGAKSPRGFVLFLFLLRAPTTHTETLLTHEDIYTYIRFSNTSPRTSRAGTNDVRLHEQHITRKHSRSRRQAAEKACHGRRRGIKPFPTAAATTTTAPKRSTTSAAFINKKHRQQGQQQ